MCPTCPRVVDKGHPLNDALSGEFQAPYTLKTVLYKLKKTVRHTVAATNGSRFFRPYSLIQVIFLYYIVLPIHVLHFREGPSWS